MYYLIIHLLTVKGIKSVSEKTYFQFLFESSLGDYLQVGIRIRDLSRKYGKMPVLLSDYDVYLKLKEIYILLCDDLATGEFTTIEFYL